MQRGLFGFQYPTGRNVVQQVVSAAGQPSVLGSGQGNGAMKASIVLFDSAPGTRSWKCPLGVSTIRAFVVGGAGGANTSGGSGGGYSEIVMTVQPGSSYSYTVGAAGTPGGTPTGGGTSSFNSVISATGGSANGGSGGVGSGGSVNTSGGVGTGGGGASGHRFGNGGGGGTGLSGGGGWAQAAASSGNGGDAGIDGWGLGLVPGHGGKAGIFVNLGGGTLALVSAENGGYGAGGGSFQGVSTAANLTAGNGGLGGGGGANSGSSYSGNGGLGAGAGGNSASLLSPSGNGAVGIEVLG